MSRIEFTNREGLTLTGNFEKPAQGDCRATVLFAHCFTCGRNLRGPREITRALADAGFGVLRFDFTGLGESEGEFADSTFSSNLDDLEDAAEWLAGEAAAPQLLVGHSLGGTAALAVAERLDSVQAIATIGSPSSPENVLKHFDDRIEEIENHGAAEVDLAGRTFRIRRDFIEDARNHRLDERLRNLERALLLLHSPLDRTVSIDHAQKIFTQARHPKSFISLDRADHLISDPADAFYAARMIATWAAHFLEMDRER